MVEELQRARLEDQRDFQSRLERLETALKRQMTISDGAVKKLDSVQQELNTAQSKSRSLRQQLQESNWKLSNLSDQQMQAEQIQDQQSAETAARETAIMQQAEEIAACFDQLQCQASGKQASTSQPASTPVMTQPEPMQVEPTAPPAQSWVFSQPLEKTHESLFNVSIKPPEPPAFTGDRDQDIVSWLTMVKDYLALVQPSEQQAVSYVILRLQKNARCWWEAELASRGGHRPDTLEELMMLLRAQFESPVRENRARAKLLRLQ